MSSLRRREETTSYVYTRLDRKRSYTGEGHYSDPGIYKPSEGKNDTGGYRLRSFASNSGLIP